MSLAAPAMPSAQTIQGADKAQAASATPAPTTPAQARAARDRAAPGALRDYATLTKPGITFLVLVTTLVGCHAGAGGLGFIEPLLLFHAIGGALAVVSGASVLNQWLERDADGLMKRTRNRPLPAGRVAPEKALLFGAALSVAGLAWLGLGAGWAACAVAGASWLLYVLVYTPLKRVTAFSTIIGAVPGALPPVIGWAAARGDLDYGAWVLFSIMFLWQFPHFLALGWIYREDYKRGGMITLASHDVDGSMTRRQSIGYAAALAPVSLLPTLAGMAGPLYFAVALILSLGYVWKAWQVRGADIDKRARGLFLYSIVYLPIMLGALMVETLILGPLGA